MSGLHAGPMRPMAVFVNVAIVAIVATLGIPTQQATAHQRSESFSHWQFKDQRLSVRLTLIKSEAQRLFPAASDRARHEDLGAYLLQRLRPSAESGCRQTEEFRRIESGEGFLQLQATWDCPNVPSTFDIAVFFDRVSGHSHLISLRTADGFFQRLLAESKHGLSLGDIETSGQAPTSNMFALYVVEGAQHIVGGADHVIFLLALLLICRSGKGVVWAATGFTLGHSISLLLAVLGFVRPIVPAIEAAIGLTIVLVAVERASNFSANARVAAVVVAAILLMTMGLAESGVYAWQRLLLFGLAAFAFCYLMLARELNTRGPFRLLMTGIFGLIHGFGFAGAFLATELPKGSLAVTLAGFNIGVEIGQLLLIGLLVLLSRLGQLLPQRQQILSDVLAAAVCGIGTFWFFDRLLGV